jgi:gliding motility-associated-like protein
MKTWKLMIKRLLLICTLTSLYFMGFSQSVLRSDFNNPTEISVFETCVSEQYTFDHTAGIDLELPRCYREYPGASSYFTFQVPENSMATVRIGFDEVTLFGIAFYTLEDGQYVELKCDVFRSTQGNLRILPVNDLGGSIILARFWKLGEAESGLIDLCVSGEEYQGFQKALAISTTLYSVNELVEDVLITGCLTASNIQYTGHQNAIGYFSNGIPGLDFENGVILSSGNVLDAAGPNTSGSTGTDFGQPGNALLNAITNGTTEDAAILEFDFVPASDLLEFQYVFGSDEYPEFANSSYNDVFAFLISGGPENYNNVNIALIPGTATPVTINNVNATNNSQYYIDNQFGANVEYDGLTVTLTATKPVTACETYNIKLGVADVFDGIYDSAVFLKANSFSSGESYTVESFNSWSASVSVMRGCSNYIVFSRTDATPLNQPVPIEMTVSGTATPGVDYSALPDNLEIPAGEQSITVYFDAYILGAPQGDETIVLNFDNGCPCSAGTTQHTITIVDAFEVEPTLTNTGPVCNGDPVTLNLTLDTPDPDNVIIEWSTGAVDVLSVDLNPTVTTTYTVDVIFPCDTITLSTQVVVIQPPVVDLGPDLDIAALSTNINAGMAPGNTGEWTVIGGPGNATVTPANTSNTTVSVDDFGIYTIQWTETSLAPNCVSSDQIDINFYHVPTAEFEATPIDCFGDNTTITFTGDVIPGFATFDWDFGSGTVISGSGQGPYVVNFPTTGNHTVIVTVTEGVAVVSNSITVVVPPLLTGDLTVIDDPCFQSCNGRASIIMTGGVAPYNYSWGSSTNEMTNLCVGDYGLLVTDANGCEFYVTFEIKQPSLLEFDTSYYHVSCFGTQTGGANIWGIGGTPPYTYLWSDGFGAGAHNNIAAGTIQVTVSDANGCSLMEQFNITEPQLLQVVTSGDYAICEHQSVNVVAQELGGTAPYTFYWDNGDGNGFSVGPQTFNIVPHEDVTYTVYVVDGQGCVSNYAFTEIIVSPEIHLTLNTNNNTCYQTCDGNALLGVSGGLQPFNYSWAVNGPYLNHLCAGLYTVTLTDQIGCRADTMFVITQPSALQLIMETENARCSYSNDGSSIANVIGGTPPYNYVWSDNNQTNELAAGPGTYHLTVSDDNNCRIYGTANISAPQELRILTLYNPTICIGGTATVVGQASGGTQPYQFYWQGTDGVQSWEHLFQTSPDTTTMYHLTVTDNNGCTVAGNKVTVNVHPPLQIVNIINSVNNVCLGKSTYIELDIIGGNGGPYEITTNSGELISSPFLYTPEETTNLIFYVEDLCETPMVSDSIMIYVHPSPIVDFSIETDQGCPGEPIAFAANDTIDTNTYVWDFGDDVFAFIKNPVHAYEESGFFDVTLTVRSQYGCKDSLTVHSMVEIFPKPYANFSASPEVVGILNPKIKFINHSEQALFYFWYYGDGDSTINFKNPEHYYKNLGEYEVMLVSENEYGCTDTAIRIVLVKEQYTIYAAEAFTPNGDGRNDCFRICGNGINPHTFIMTIYNRWGELVYSTDKFDGDVACDSCGEGAWDGTRGSRMKGDKYLPNGVYYWYVRFTDYDSIGHEFNGNIQLIR